jgi:hypothetical protein
MEQALAAPLVAKRYARAAQDLVTERFSLATHVARLQSVYQSVLAA